MPVTPGGRFSPGDSDDWDLVTDLAAMQVSNEVASAAEIAASPRFYRIGPNSERLAIPAAQRVEGLKFYASDTRIEWLYTNGAWRGDRGIFFTQRTAAQGIGVGWNVLNAVFGAPNINDLGTWSGGALTIARAGLYRITASLDLLNATSPVSTQITRNSTSPDTPNTVLRSLLAVSGNALPISGTALLSAGDAIRMLVYSGVNNQIGTTNGPSSTSFSLELIRAL